MDISMIGSFQLLKNIKGKYVPISMEETHYLSTGGYSFNIDGNSIPFDWDAYYATEDNFVFYFETGRGPFFDDYEISDCYDDQYKDIGIKREEITAEFLANVNHIDEFFVNFDDNDGKEQCFGWYTDNAHCGQYKINLLTLALEDIKTGEAYYVSKEVIDKFNKGGIVMVTITEKEYRKIKKLRDKFYDGVDKYCEELQDTCYFIDPFEEIMEIIDNARRDK